MRKIVSFASTPNEAIKWSELGKYKRLSKEELYIYDFENIEEVHFIGSKKGENDYEIEETKWGIYINMEEALIISSDGLGDIRYWNRHLKKLLDNYNPIGIPEVYLISYVECSKDKFKELWINYLTHIKTYSCDEYIIQRTEEENLEQSFYIQGIKSVYDRCGMPTTVYNIFIRLGD